MRQANPVPSHVVSDHGRTGLTRARHARRHALVPAVRHSVCRRPGEAICVAIAVLLIVTSAVILTYVYEASFLAAWRGWGNCSDSASSRRHGGPQDESMGPLRRAHSAGSRRRVRRPGRRARDRRRGYSTNGRLASVLGHHLAGAPDLIYASHLIRVSRCDPIVGPTARLRIRPFLLSHRQFCKPERPSTVFKRKPTVVSPLVGSPEWLLFSRPAE